MEKKAALAAISLLTEDQLTKLNWSKVLNLKRQQRAQEASQMDAQSLSAELFSMGQRMEKANEEQRQRMEKANEEQRQANEALRISISMMTDNVGETSNTVGAFVESVIGATLQNIYTKSWEIGILHPLYLPFLDRQTISNLMGDKTYFHSREFDFIVLGRNKIVIMEVKTNLREKHMNKLLFYLNNKSDLDPILSHINSQERAIMMQRRMEDSEILSMNVRTQENTEIYGAFGYFKYGSDEEKIKRIARNEGLFLIQGVPRGSAEIINLEDHKFRNFSNKNTGSCKDLF